MTASVAMCTYNGEQYIEKQLESIVSQSHSVIEIIICDDQSSDATVTIIAAFMQLHPGIIKFLQNPRNIGAIRSFERCIQHCSGDVIFLSDQDDLWHADKSQKLLDVLAADERALAVFSDGDLIDQDGQPLGGTLWEKWKFTPELQAKWQHNEAVLEELVHNRNVITGATLAFKKELLPKLLPFELPAGYWHDAWIGLVAAGLGGLRFLPDATISYRIHSQQQVGVNPGAGDNRFEAVPRAKFLANVHKLFPASGNLIYAEEPWLLGSPGLLKRAFRRFRRLFT